MEQGIDTPRKRDTLSKLSQITTVAGIRSNISPDGRNTSPVPPGAAVRIPGLNSEDLGIGRVTNSVAMSNDAGGVKNLRENVTLAYRVRQKTKNRSKGDIIEKATVEKVVGMDAQSIRKKGKSVIDKANKYLV